MEESLFNKLIRLGGEDITTEILLYLLTDKEYNHIKNLIMPIIDLNYSYDKIYTFQTQKRFDTYDRPDLIIESGEEIFIIENKFNAEFSKNNQVQRYIELLTRMDEYNSKNFILLTVRNRQHYLENKIKKQIKTKDIEDHCKKLKINYRVVLWNEILKVIKCHDTLIRELEKFIEANYIKSTSINRDEKKMLNSKAVPELLIKIWNAISLSKDFLSEKGYIVSRTSQSRTTYLYNVEFPWGKLCIQLFIDFWEKYETPFVVQAMNDWLKSDVDLEKLLKIDFIEDENYEYLYPVRLEENDLSLELNKKLLDLIHLVEENIV